MLASGEYSLDRPLSKKMLGLLDRKTRKAYSRDFRSPRPLPKTPPRVGVEIEKDIEVRLSEEEYRELKTRDINRTHRQRGRKLVDRDQGAAYSPEVEEEEEIELEEEALLALVEKTSQEEMELDLGGSLTHPTVPTETGLDLAGFSGQGLSSPPTSEPQFGVAPNFAQYVHSRSEPSWVPPHTLHFFSEEFARTSFQRGLEIPLKDLQGSRAEDSESSDSDGTEQPGGDPVVKLPLGQGRQGTPEVQTFGEGGATSATGKPGDRSTFFTEDKYQSLVEKIDQNLLTFQKATEVFQNSMQTMTDSFKTLSEEVKNQSSRIAILEGQFEKAQQKSEQVLTDSTNNLASDILSKVIENLNVPFDRAIESSQQFAAASTEQQKGESSKATKMAEESRQLEEEAQKKCQRKLRQKPEKIVLLSRLLSKRQVQRRRSERNQRR